MHNLVVYTAATVLLAERLMPPRFQSVGRDRPRAQATWDRTIRLLQAYSRVAESAQRCLLAVQILSTKITSNISGPHVEQDMQNPNAVAGLADTSFATARAGDGFNYEELMTPIDLGSLDFDIDDMFWLDDPAGDFFF